MPERSSELVSAKSPAPIKRFVPHRAIGDVDITAITAKAKRLLRSITPIPVENRLFAARFRKQAPPPGRIHWGALRRTTPISRKWGYDRGTSIYRGYMAEFL